MIVRFLSCSDMYVYMTGHRDVVLTLLRYNAEWSLGNIQWRRTALHMAAMKGHADLVRLLIELHSDQVGFTSERTHNKLLFTLTTQCLNSTLMQSRK